ncbi:MAG: iron-sulfur cluster insertion protein ErpA [Dongiaceae bacterium]
MSETTTDLRPITISERAARRIAALMSEESNPKLMLRVAVSGGGCSGFQYGFTLDDAKLADDLLFEKSGITVVIDTTSMELIQGAEIDFVEDLVGASFQVRNPNASSSCGCGNSFSI